MNENDNCCKKMTCFLIINNLNLSKHEISSVAVLFRLANGSKYSSNPPSPLRSTNNVMKVRFISDGSVYESGVLMSYILGKNSCTTY